MRIQPKKQQNIQNAKTRKHISTTTEDLYKNRSNGDKVFIDIPGAKGIEVFIITGPELLDVVKKYNLLSGGGRERMILIHYCRYLQCLIP